MDADLLDRVRKLLAKAEDAGCTPSEAEALTAKAAELMARYGIDRALLGLRDPGRRDAVTSKWITVETPYALSRASLVFAIARPLRVYAIRTRERCYDGKNRYVYRMHLFGYEADLIRVEILYTSLLLQAANAMKDLVTPAGRDKGAFRESWLQGFAWGVSARLQRAEEKAAGDAEAEGTPGVALVLADRFALVTREAEKAYPDLKAGKARKLKGGGEWDGYDAGLKADVGQQRVGSERAAIA